MALSKKKILYLNDFGDLGGTQKILFYVAKVIDKSKYDVEFVFGSKGEIYEHIQALGFTCHLIELPHLISWDKSKIYVPFNFFRYVMPFVRLILFLSKSDAEIVVTNSIKFELIGSLAAKLMGKRLFWHTHNIQPAGFRRRFIRWMASHLPEKIIAVSNAVKESYRGSKAFDKIVVVENGIDIPKANAKKRQRNGYFNVLMLSILTAWKGHKVLIDAFELLEENGEASDIKAVIAGEPHKPKDKKYAEELVEYSGHSVERGRITFIGKISDVHVCLRDSDVLVNLSTLPDPFPTVLLEAMSQGVPSIATNIGGQPEIVKHNINGLLIEPNNPQQLADAILFCKSNPEILERFSKQCLKDFAEKYNLDSYRERYNRVLDELVFKAGYENE